MTSQAVNKKIAICGAFDMRNFGDLLFPVLAQERLGPLGYEVNTFAPTNSDPGLGLAAPRRINDLFDCAADYAGILIGGGYIIHSQPVSKIVHLTGVSQEQAQINELADCWIGASLAGATHSRPVAWNAPGVPFPMTRGQRDLVVPVLKMADYLSVRDQSSRELLGVTDLETANVVPDPIAEISRIWPKEELTARAERFIADNGIEQPILALHVRDRSLLGLGAEKLGKMISDLSRTLGLTPVLLALGQAHQDEKTARNVAEHISVPHAIQDDPASLKDVAAVLAHSRLYAGASLHGYIAATSYAVPGVLIGRPAYSKFAGYVAHTGWSDDLCDDWQTALQRAGMRFAEPQHRALPQHVFDAVDRHWTAIAAVFEKPVLSSADRAVLVSDYVRRGATRRGISWTTSPIHLNKQRKSE